MDHRDVEECPLGQREICDRVSVVEALHVWPVLLGIDHPALGCTKCHLTVECLREDLVEVTLGTGDSGAIRQCDSAWRDFRGWACGLDEGGTEIEEARPFSRILGGRGLPVGGVDDGVRTIPKQPAFHYLGGIQFLTHHGLDGVPPQRNHRTNLDLRCG